MHYCEQLQFEAVTKRNSHCTTCCFLFFWLPSCWSSEVHIY